MKIAVFGYGSLVNKASLERTLGKVHKIRPAVLSGWARDWSAILENTPDKSHYQLTTGEVPPKVAVLNIQPSDSSFINGVLIDCTEQDLDRLVKREIHYDLVDVTSQIENTGYDKIYSFTAKPEFTGSRDTDIIIPESYVDLAEEGFGSLSKDQLEIYLKTTPTPINRVRDAKFIIR